MGKRKKKSIKPITNNANSTIHLNITTCPPQVEKSSEMFRPSAFRAVNSAKQSVAANTPMKVLYPNTQFDISSEYCPDTSSFTPKTNGVYSIIGFIGFRPCAKNNDYRTRVEIRINGNSAIAIDNDFFGGGTSSFANGVAVSTIMYLKAGDYVEIYAESSVPGVILSLEGGSHFEAARFPSPTI